MKRKFIRWYIALVLAALCTTWVSALPRMLVPGGCTVGIKLQGQGVIITGFEEDSAAKRAGLKVGDMIIAVNGTHIHTVDGLRKMVNDDPLMLTVLRKGSQTQISVQPAKKNGGNRLGAYIRDSIAGIGTVTYYDPETGDFGALGHGVNDADAEILLPVESGVVVASSVREVHRGKDGEPGELKGEFDIRRILGQVEKNTDDGIFGNFHAPIKGKPLPTAEQDDVKVGKAEILCNVDGTEVRSYSVEILKIYPRASETGRNLLLRVTDNELLSQTGGIVCGMSGSPIIQDGKLVGAVTHVLVNDPTRGYGIFIENMLDAAG